MTVIAAQQSKFKKVPTLRTAL